MAENEFKDIVDDFINDILPSTTLDEVDINGHPLNRERLADRYRIRIGQKFDFGAAGLYEGIFMLAHVNYNELNLVGLKDGNRWNDPSIPYSISSNGFIYIEDFKKLLGTRHNEYKAILKARIPNGTEIKVIG